MLIFLYVQPIVQPFVKLFKPWTHRLEAAVLSYCRGWTEGLQTR